MLLGACETSLVSALTGRLLIAEPMLGDPNFDRAVVLVVQHTADGALGLVLNQPTDVLVADALPAWAPMTRSTDVIHVGGPVEPLSGWCLARVRDPESLPGFVALVGDLGLLDLELDPADVELVVHEVRLYAGYSGWGPGQLEHELGQEAWFVADPEPQDPFQPDRPALWARILARQAGPLARLALFPPDPSVN